MREIITGIKTVIKENDPLYDMTDDELWQLQNSLIPEYNKAVGGIK